MQRRLKQAIAHPWLRRFILIGYAAKGSIYLLIGVLTTQAALFPAEEAAGTYSALDTLLRQPLGQIILCLLAVGLLGYVLRRLIQAAIDPGHDHSAKRIVNRIGYVISAMSYTGVIFTAIQLAISPGEGDDTIEDLTGELLELPFGEWLVFLGGIAVATIGIGYIYGAWTGSYVSEFESSDIHHRVERWATIIGKLGVAARGVAYALIGIFLIQAALSGYTETAGGLQNAFRVLKTQPFGSLWLGLIGVGFIFYGLYMFVAAKYRRFTVR